MVQWSESSNTSETTTSTRMKEAAKQNFVIQPLDASSFCWLEEPRRIKGKNAENEKTWNLSKRNKDQIEQWKWIKPRFEDDLQKWVGEEEKSSSTIREIKRWEIKRETEFEIEKLVQSEVGRNSSRCRWTKKTSF